MGRVRNALPGQISAKTGLDWLEATRDIKALVKIPRTTRAFARLFAKGLNLSESDLVSVKPVGREMLRKARVRLDVTAMMELRQNFLSVASARILCCFRKLHPNFVKINWIWSCTVNPRNVRPRNLRTLVLWG